MNACEWSCPETRREVGCSVVEVTGLWVFVKHLMRALGTELGSSRSAASTLYCWHTFPLLPTFTHFPGRRKPWASPTQNRQRPPYSTCEACPIPSVCNQHRTRVIRGFEIDTKIECPLVAVPASTKPLTNTLARCKMTFKICFLRKVPLKTNCQELATQTSLRSDITTPRFSYGLYERNQNKTTYLLKRIYNYLNTDLLFCFLT